MTSITRTIEQPTDMEIDLPCSKCANETSHKVLTRVKQVAEYARGTITEVSNYNVVICGGCKCVSFCIAESNSEDVDIDEEGEQYHPVAYTPYPPRLNGRKLVDETTSLPHGIATVYKEMHSSLCSGNYILTGIGIRALLEAIVNDKKAKGGNLAERITGLISLGLITKDGADILHAIRVLGNKAAHEVVANSLSELNAAIDVVEHLIASVYLIPQKAKILKTIKRT